MKVKGVIQVKRRVSGRPAKTTTIYEETFEAKSIQSAKAQLTKIANKTELFEYIQSWDEARVSVTGKDFDWLPWKNMPPFQQADRTDIGWSTRTTHARTGETVDSEYSKYEVAVTYRADMDLYWKLTEVIDD